MNRNPLKRLISFALSLFMTFSIIFADNAIITAFAEKTNVKTYNYDNFKVEYIIDSEWESAQSVRIKISNTGDEAILNWYLKYNTSGAIENIYNATLYSESNGEYILKHNGYNYEIGAGDSVELGYILKGDDLAFPEEFKMCNKRVEKESGYTVDFNIISEWDAGFNADIVITNDTDSPIEAWTLAFDSNFNINNYWNCKLISNESDRYNFANQLWTTPIPAGGTASFGFTADKIDGATPIAENWVLTEVVIDLTPIVEPQSFNIFGFVEYAADSNSLLISWISEYDEGIFEIYTSNDGITFEKYTEVSNCSSYTYAVTEDFDKKYFIIKQILDNGNIGESSIILITKGKNGYSMEFPDSDSDGVADYLEEAFGLDINKTDTDDDGLSDYEEMFITGTDPTVYDSVKKGVSDAEADSDNDGLTNKQELSIGTNPVIPDSDGDNLTDGDEVNKYGTNPLIPDSDDDKINDGDEIKLGLDPLNPNTFGVPDSEYTFNVGLTDNSDAMSEINTSDNEYKLSIELKAAGNVSENISVTESNYSETIKNSAIIGKSFDIEYDEACKVDEVVIKFTLNEDTITESELGIERYCVFKLFEEYNILLPVYTEYDLNNGKLSSQVDEVGTYCLMDMEKLVDSFCSASETQEIEQSTEDVQPIMLYSSRNSGVWQNGIDKSSINVVFILDIRDNIDDESFENIKTNIVKTAAEVLKESSNAKIYLLLQHYDKVSSNMLGYTVLDDDDQEFFTDSLKIYNALDEIRTNSVDDVNSYCILSDAIKYVYDNCDNSNGTYCFSIFDSADVVYRTSLVGEDIIGVTGSDDYGYEVLNKLRENTIDVSVISNIAPEYNLGYAIDLYDSTGGIYIDGFGDISDEMLKHIYGYIPDHDEESTVFYNGLNFEEMQLKSEVTMDYLSAAKELGTKMQDILAAEDKSELEKIREAYSEYADSDSDFVYDFEEIDVFNSLIDWSDNGKIILPTIEDYCNAINDKNVAKAMKEYIRKNWDPLLTLKVMPVISDPMKPDTDGDGFVDYYEVLYNRNKAISTFSLDNSNNSDTYFYDPIKVNEWQPQSEVARLTMIGGYSYDPMQHIIYSNKTPIQRFFGFADSVDFAANPILASAILCDPIYFYYGGKEYRLELWKGQYGIMAGCEVGLYYREPCVRNLDPLGIINFYDDAKGTQKWYRSAADNDLINVSYSFDAVNEIDSNKKIEFVRDAKHWWTTGFKWGAKTSPTGPEMNITIEFKNEEMKNAFLTGGEIPYAVSSDSKKLIKDQTWGFLNAVKKSESSSDIVDKLVEGTSSVSFIYKGAIINKQPQDPNQVNTILNANNKFIEVYKKVKEHAGISFEENDIRYTNDPNFMTINMWKDAFEETGYLKCEEYKAWKIQYYKDEGKPWEFGKKSPLFKLVWELAGGSTSLRYSKDSMECLLNVLDVNLEALGLEVKFGDVLGLVVDFDDNLDILVGYGETIANTSYRNDCGESGYLYEWYPRWYDQYERTLCSSITKWYYDSEEGSPDVEYGDYIYAMNHLPGMTYSLLYIYKCIDKIHP